MVKYSSTGPADASAAPLPGTGPAIAVRSISKQYEKGAVQALKEISFEVHTGELFGLIGPDGAGKTTLFRILTTLLAADRGTASVMGWDVVSDYRQIRRSVGYMPGRFSLYPDLTVAENLAFFATLFGTSVGEHYGLIKDIYEQIRPFSDRRAAKLSGGMKQKLALCCALVHKPSVLFLDEPTTGVDVVSRREFWEVLQKLKQQGITILVSTPYMEEATICDRIALIQEGALLNVDTPQHITQTFPSVLYGARAANSYALLKTVLAWEQTDTCYPFGSWLHITLKEPAPDGAAALLRYLRMQGHTDASVERIAPSIEDCFIQLAARKNKNNTPQLHGNE